ncbi:MAG: class I SAM-dependent methyltransferase [Candidatus Omnitrophica bacterium]|nr:class I SAM-dependent methyltransferase [Candidatus Omnitrophota bacterium]
MNEQADGALSGYLRFIRLHTAKPFLAPAILDVGCGKGHLAQYFDPNSYTGTDINPEAIACAKKDHPRHCFHLMAELPPNIKFRTIALLAVIEHLADPGSFMHKLADKLEPEGKIIITTPHPAFRKIYETGACLGLFNHSAAEEHHQYLDWAAMDQLTKECRLKIGAYQRFLWGANQLFILEHT